ncbi:hypothetical protein DFR33_11053 [Bradymonas sediminis]|nr:hypothetical protein DFR33_11053 [Bradymonas sediminis]
MKELFGDDVRTVNERLGNVYTSDEKDENATIWSFWIVRIEDKRSVSHQIAL